MIEVEREGGVVRLFLNRPEKANALNSAMLDALRQSLEKLDAKVDLGVAAKGTQFAMPEVRIGIPSVVEAALLPRLMGSGRAAWRNRSSPAIRPRFGFRSN